MGCGCRGSKKYLQNRNYVAKTISKWNHLDITETEATEEFLEVKPNKKITTKEIYSGPIEILLTARTENNNIRIRAFNRAEVIANWEVDTKQLRVHRPDGSITSVAFVPLLPEIWHEFLWSISEKGMSVYVNNQLLFQEASNYTLMPSPIYVGATDSVVDVKEFVVNKK